MHKTIEMLEKLGQSVSIKQFDTLESMIYSQGLSSQDIEVNSQDQICAIHPADDDD